MPFPAIGAGLGSIVKTGAEALKKELPAVGKSLAGRVAPELASNGLPGKELSTGHRSRGGALNLLRNAASMAQLMPQAGAALSGQGTGGVLGEVADLAKGAFGGSGGGSQILGMLGAGKGGLAGMATHAIESTPIGEDVMKAGEWGIEHSLLGLGVNHSGAFGEAIKDKGSDFLTSGLGKTITGVAQTALGMTGVGIAGSVGLGLLQDMAEKHEQGE